MSPKHPKPQRVPIPAEFGSMQLETIGISAFDWRDPYHLAVTLSWPKFFALMFALYAVVNLVFAGLYLLVPGSVSNMEPGSLLQAFFFSVETLATVGYGYMAPITTYAHVVSLVEIFLGLMMTATMTGLVFVRFSRPKAKLIFADHCVLTRHGDKKMLMIRIGNGRVNALMEAQAKLTVLLLDHSSGGQVYRRTHDLKLQRHEIPFFALPWTLMHEIDAHSPLCSVQDDVFCAAGMRLILSVSARDPVLSAQVNATRSYGGDQVKLNMRYVDLVSWDGKNRSVADLRKLSETEPDGSPEPAAPLTTHPPV